MMTKLPSVDEACNMILQEESKKELFRQINNEGDVMAMSSKRAGVTCSNCGKTGHSNDKCWAYKACGKASHIYERCWTVRGYPNKSTRNQRDKRCKGKKMMRGHRGT
ncbi:Gag-Pol polyprotein [Bienertia sinuspersici]